MVEGFQGTVGTISHGTLRYVDLIPAMANAIREIEPDHIWLDHYSQSEDVIARADNDSDLSDQDIYLFEEAFDILNDLAPEGYYFGAHEGDGSDYGFWPVTS